MSEVNNISPIHLINSYLPNLSNVETQIANYVLENYSDIPKQTIGQISQTLNVAESSIIRFTRTIGYSGFREFKIQCAAYPENKEVSKYFDFIPLDSDSMAYILQQYLKFNLMNIESNLKFLDYTNIEEISQLFLTGKNIYIVGEGYSGNLAEGFYTKAILTLPKIHIITDRFKMSQLNYIVDENSLVFAISQSGRNDAIVDVVDQANKVNATTICLTASNNNPLSKRSQYQIVLTPISVEGLSSYFTNEVIFKIILDSLYTYIELATQKEKRPNSNTFYDNLYKHAREFGSNNE